MQANEVKQAIESKLEGSNAITSGEGCDFQVTVISDEFEGLRAVQRQQRIYACLTTYITDGSIHALTIKAHTNSEWQNLQK